MYISAVMIIVTVIFAVSSAFILRRRSGAERACAACALAHLAIFDCIAVAALEIFKYGYMVNQYTSEDVIPSVFVNSHTAAVSFLTVLALICMLISVNGSRIGKFVPFLIICGVTLAAAGAGAFVIFRTEAAAASLAGEYTSAIIPVIIGTAVLGVFTAANLLLDTSVGWQRVIMTVINLIDLAVFVTVFVLMLGWGKEISDGSAEIVYAVAFFGIIIILPSIICMCSAFAPQAVGSAGKKSAGKH